MKILVIGGTNSLDQPCARPFHSLRDEVRKFGGLGQAVARCLTAGGSFSSFYFVFSTVDRSGNM